MQLHNIKISAQTAVPPKTPTLIDDATDQACGKSTSTLHVATASRDGHQASTAGQGSMQGICGPPCRHPRILENAKPGAVSWDFRYLTWSSCYKVRACCSFSKPNAKMPHRSSTTTTTTTTTFQNTGTCKDSVAKGTHIVFLGDCILQDEYRDATSGGWQSSVHCYLRRHGTSSAIVHAQGAARVEAIPAEPQGEGAQHNQWKIVDFKLFRILEATLARSQDNSAHQARYATRQVDNASKWMLCVGPEKNWTGQLPCWFVIKHDKA